MGPQARWLMLQVEHLADLVAAAASVAPTATAGLPTPAAA
jgi:hypothetical protein